MDDKDLYDRGLKLRMDMFGRDAVEKRMNAFGEFGRRCSTSSTPMRMATSGSERRCRRRQNRWS